MRERSRARKVCRPWHRSGQRPGDGRAAGVAGGARLPAVRAGGPLLEGQPEAAAAFGGASRQIELLLPGPHEERRRIKMSSNHPSSLRPPDAPRRTQSPPVAARRGGRLISGAFRHGGALGSACPHSRMRSPCFYPSASALRKLSKPSGSGPAPGTSQSPARDCMRDGGDDDQGSAGDEAPMVPGPKPLESREEWLADPPTTCALHRMPAVVVRVVWSQGGPRCGPRCGPRRGPRRGPAGHRGTGRHEGSEREVVKATLVVFYSTCLFVL